MKIASSVAIPLFLVLFTRPHTTFSQQSNDSTTSIASLKIDGFVDGYFEYNFNQPLSRINQLRNFDFNSNRPKLNLAEISLLLPPQRFGFRLDLNYGPQTTKWIHAADPTKRGILRYIQQFFLSYKMPIGKDLTIDVGKFVTQHGAEVIETKDNWNYSRSLLFAWAIPYYHAGVRAGYPFFPQFTFNAYVVNGWNMWKENNSGKTIGLQGLLTLRQKVGVVLNYMRGPEQAQNTSRVRSLFDFVITYSDSAKLSMMFNCDYGMDRAGTGEKVFWWGIGVYARYELWPRFVIAPRLEFFNDHDGFTTGQAQSLTEATLTFEPKVDDLFTWTKGLSVRVEARLDNSKVNFFESSNGKKHSQFTILVGLSYVLVE